MNSGKDIASDFSITDRDRIIEMAWEDRTPFEAIEMQFGLKDKAVIAMMRREMQPSSFKLWRKRTAGRATKHMTRRALEVNRFKCSLQKQITHNKISKRAH